MALLSNREYHVNNLTAAAVNETRTYTYDTHGNLTKSVKTDNSSGSAVTATYGYDKVGNRTSMTEEGVTTTYIYNAINQLKTQTTNGTTVNYSYDYLGNCIKESGGSSTVDMEYAVTGEMTMLTKTESGTTTLTQTNVYNHNGQRISRTQSGTTRNYYYDRGVAVFTVDGTSLSGANVLDAEGDAIGTYRGSVYYNYLKDGQASTTNLIKEDGTLAAAYDYSDFGETTEITGSSFDNQICYTGGIYDESTALYYLNARYYDPEIGRFISQDSYRGELNDPGQWHLYAYCANNPINYVDPSGHWYVNTNKSSNKYSASIVIPWKEVSEILTKTGVVMTFISIAISRIPNPIFVAASSTFLVLGVSSMIVTMILDKYAKNKSLIISLSFKYQKKYKNRTVTRKSRKYTYKYSYYKIYNIKCGVKLRG